MYIIYIYVYIYMYIYIYIYYIEQCRMGKTLVNTTNFPTNFGCGYSQGACCLYDF